MNQQSERRIRSTAPTGSCCAWILDAKHHPNCPRAPQDTLGNALATGVLRGVKGWVWCEGSQMPEPESEHYYGEDGMSPQPCPDSHHPLYIARPSTADQPLPESIQEKE